MYIATSGVDNVYHIFVFIYSFIYVIIEQKLVNATNI